MNRLKLLALCHFDVIEPKGGGQVVVFNFLDKLSRYFDITLLSLNSYGNSEREVQLNPYFRQIVIPQSYEQAKIMWEMEQRIGEGLFDIVQVGFVHLNKDFLNTFAKLSSEVDIIVFEHPYLFNVLKSVSHKHVWIYHALDFEYRLKQNLFKNAPVLLKSVYAIEKAVCTSCDIILSPTENEKKLLHKTYNIPENKIILTPHGINLKPVPYITRDKHSEYTKQYKEYTDKSILLFIGSWHPPNLEALNFIIEKLAPANENFLYIVIGSVKNYFERKYQNRQIPNNVILVGSVEEQIKWEYYKLADIAINPMFSGAGVNVKMIEYMAAGLPIVSTVFGARGIEMGKNTPLCDSTNFYDCINRLIHKPDEQILMVHENRMICLRKYDYSLIVREIVKKVINVGFVKGVDANHYYSFILIDNISDELSTIVLDTKDKLIDRISIELSNIL